MSKSSAPSKLHRNIFIEYLLLWVFPTLWLGARNKLKAADVPNLPPHLTSEILIPKAVQSWSKHKNLPRIIWDVAKRDIVIGIVASVVSGIVTVVVRPLLLGLIVENLEEVATSSEPEEAKLNTLRLIGVLVVVLTVEGLSVVTVKHALADVLGHTMFTAYTGLIQQKLQKLPISTKTSQELGLVGNDIFRMYENLRFSCQIIVCFTGFIGGITVLVIQLGLASVVGISVMLIILFGNMFLAHKSAIAEERDLEAADKRLQLLRQMITGIKAIKLCAWEESFLKKILAAREEEMIHLRRFRLYMQSGVQIGRACPVVSAASSFLFFALSGEEVSAGRLFSALNVFLGMRMSLIVIPESIAIAAAARVSLKRMHRYLTQDEVEQLSNIQEMKVIEGTKNENGDHYNGANGNYKANGNHKSNGNDEFLTNPAKALMEPELELTDVNNDVGVMLQGRFQWPESPGFILSTENAKIMLPRGKSLAVIARVGNGKTSFLHALLGELAAVEKDSKVNIKNNHAATAFIPQQPFILGETVKQNIILNTNKNDDAIGVATYEKFLNIALSRSALVTDLKLLTNGLKTVIGEKGINFSGGQQQRVAIARAVYHTLKTLEIRKNSKVKQTSKGVLMVVDDALAAVDVAVADHLFNQVFMQHIKDDENNSLVMALNQPKYLKHFDYVAELQDGKVVNFMSVRDLESGSSGGLQSVLGFFSTTSQTVLADRDTDKVENAEKLAADNSSAENQKHGIDDLYEADVNASGVVSLSVLSKYVNSIGKGLFSLCLLTGLLTYAMMAFGDLWFSYWVEEVEARNTSAEEGEEGDFREDDLRFVTIYSVSCGLFLTFLLLTSGLFTYAGVKGSQNLHKECMENLLHCPISFFEKTPSGRIISRFTSDLSGVDLTLSRFIDNLWQLMATLLAQIVVVAILVPPITVVILISILLYTIQAVAADRANRIVKRENNLAMSPLQLSISENIDAKVSSRVMSFNNFFDERFYHAMDEWTKFGFTSMGIINTSMLTSYVLSLLISTSTALFIVYSETLSPALAGLALTYSFLIPYFLLYSGYVFTVVMVGVNSLERVVDYTSGNLPQEPPWFLDSKTSDSSSSSITQGKIEFRSVTLIYRKGLDPALRSLSFVINGGEKIGIIGRTGAGKSSVILLLLRILDPSSGFVLIDDIDIKTLGLLQLRRSISIIPQTPLLLRGTVQDNIAPFGQAPFDAMKGAIIDSGLLASFPRQNVQETSQAEIEDILNTDIESLSAGQKQLLSLTRCLLNTDNRILICDEPTSNVDMATDKVVQKVVRSKFKASTIITVAHRLETIEDVDKIIVLDKGQVKKIDKPSVILKTEHFDESD